MAERQVDIAVYGATAGGAVAAIAAAGEGRRVLLIEPRRHVGGMVSGGLGWTDRGEVDVIGGLARQFYERVWRHYGVEPWGVLGPEPHVAEAILRDWLRQAGVDIAFEAPLLDVAKEGRSIRRIVMANGETVAANVFIDASYEGDLLAGADVSYAVGRESRSLHGESWAGRQPIRPDQHQFAVPVSPFYEDTADPLPLVHDRPLVVEGEGDGGVQSYCYRLCLTDRPGNRVPFPEPEGYERGQFELVRRWLVAMGDRLHVDRIFSLSGRLPNGKVDANSIGPISTNLPDGSSWRYPDADPAGREAIRLHHLRYTQGLMYFLTSDPDIPAHIREEMGRWGLCADEFVDTGHWPHQLYVRDARRMRGEYLLTQHDLEEGRAHHDAVGMGVYNIDIREVQRTWMPVPRYPVMRPETFNEGYLSAPVTPYQIPYRALLPRWDECDNLLAPVCVSASHVAFASVRMEPQYMLLGHAAGLAAALAVEEGGAVHRVDIGALQRRLRDQGQVLEAR